MSVREAGQANFPSKVERAVIAAICEQESIDDMGFTIEAMKKPLIALGYEIIGELSVFKIFDKAKVKDNKDAISRAYRLGKELGPAP